MHSSNGETYATTPTVAVHKDATTCTSCTVHHAKACSTDGTGTTEKTSEVRNSLTGPERLLIYVGDDEWPMLIANSTVHIFQNSRSLIT